MGMHLLIRCAKVDAKGNAWVAGETNSFYLDGQRRQRGTRLDVFLMKFDAQGVHQWTRVRGGGGDDGARALQADGLRHPSFFNLPWSKASELLTGSMVRIRSYVEWQMDQPVGCLY